MKLTPEERKARKAEYARAWFAANKERNSANKKAWRQANKERHYAHNRKSALKHPESPAYLKQRHQAKRRGIGFLLTFEEWWAIWQASGRWEQRGIRRGQYCMARFGDEGPYAVGNVWISTVEENSSDGAKKMWATTNSIS